MHQYAYPISLSVLFTLFVTAFIISTCAVFASSQQTVQVIVHSGPKECDNSGVDENGKLYKIEPHSIVGLHFTVTIDPSSSGSRSLLGKIVESSKSGIGIAPSFPVGKGKVIRGLDLGLIGLCLGSSAYIIVPPHLGYGSVGKPNVGVEPDTTLRYDVEILDIQPPIPNDFDKIDADHDWKISMREAEVYFQNLGQAIDLQGLWKDEDVDQDGYISWHEFTGSKGTDGPPHVGTTTYQNQQQSQKIQSTKEKKNGGDVITLLQSIDTDNDGKISKTELADTFRSLGQETTDDFWKESDPDGDGFISFEEFLGGKPTSTSEELAEKGNEL